MVCELLRANLYEFQKYNRENGDEPYFTLPHLQRIAHQVSTISCTAPTALPLAFIAFALAYLAYQLLHSITSLLSFHCLHTSCCHLSHICSADC